jgi:hypothetical protein
MHKETFCEAERRRLEKLNNFQLAHSYKRVGWTVVAISFALMIVKGFIDEPSWVKPVLSNIFLIGFLIISLSNPSVLLAILHKQAS